MANRFSRTVLSVRSAGHVTDRKVHGIAALEGLTFDCSKYDSWLECFENAIAGTCIDCAHGTDHNEHRKAFIVAEDGNGYPVVSCLACGSLNVNVIVLV
jgi:hypothetical protein